MMIDIIILPSLQDKTTREQLGILNYSGFVYTIHFYWKERKTRYVEALHDIVLKNSRNFRLFVNYLKARQCQHRYGQYIYIFLYIIIQKKFTIMSALAES